MTPVRLTDEQRLDWLRLIRSEGVGPRLFRSLVNRFGGAGPALDALPDLARRSGRPALRIASRSDAEREFDRFRRMGGRLVATGEPEYPPTLLATETPPPLLAIRGEVGALARPTVAIVGSRNASAAGGVLTERVAGDLGRAGFVVVSGLARGIDTRAHRAALATGTVAVLAGGHDKIYPAENEDLLEAIVAGGGAAVSEMPIGWVPRAREFPRRNRIVSGLCYGVVVVEAARRSGSLITARFALEQGREVFAVPGSPLDPRAEGTNDLIRGGATLCSSAEDVRSVLEPLLAQDPPGRSAPSLFAGERDPSAPYTPDDALWDELDIDLAADAPSADRSPSDAMDGPASDRDAVLNLLGPGPISIDDLARQAGLPIRAVNSALTELELAGRIERRGNNAVALATRTP